MQPILLSALGASNEKNGMLETFEPPETRFNFDRVALPWYGRDDFLDDKNLGLIGSTAWKESIKGGNHEAPKFEFDEPFSSTHAFRI